MNRSMLRFHPVISGIYLVGLMIWVMWFSDPVYLGAILGGLFLLGAVGGMLSALGRVLPGYLLLVLVVTIVNPLVNGRGATVLTYLGNRPVTMESLIYGAVFGLMLINLLVVFRVGRFFMNTERFLHMTSVAAPRTGLVITMAIRLVPLLKRRLDEIRTAARSLGGDEQPLTGRKQLGVAMSRLDGLVMWTLEESLQTAVAMRSRGYGTGPRSRLIPYKVEIRDLLMLSAMGVCCAVLVAGGLSGRGRMAFYPVLDRPGMNLMHFGVLCLWLLFPLLIECGEWMKWQAFRSDS